MKLLNDMHLHPVRCCECGSFFAIPQDLAFSANEDSNTIFYCPYGHALSFSNTPAAFIKRKPEVKDNVVYVDFSNNNISGDNVA